MSKEATDAIEHYLNHGEPEMAFEGLVLEMIRVREYSMSTRSIDWLGLARECGLEKSGGVFEYEVFEKLCSWVACDERGE